jgi:class 3 adenylate cyclase
MARLSASERARLPDSAFAYIDSAGARRLPIHDEAHVRNALARFEQVRFENQAARERARKRLLNAAKRYGILPVGFITGQLRTEGAHAAAGRLVIELGRVGAPGELEQRLRRVLRDPTLLVLYWSEAAGAYLDSTGKPIPLPADHEQRAVTYLERFGRPMTALVHDPRVLEDPDLTETVLAAVRFVIEKERLHGEVQAGAGAATLPTGFVTLLFTDIEGSTQLVTRLGDRYAKLLGDVRGVVRRAVLAASGQEVEARADEYFAVFEKVAGAIEAAVALQRRLQTQTWPDGLSVRVRAGIHSGPITLTDTGYIGLSVHTAARICSAAHGGQIVVSEETRACAGEIDGIGFRRLGRYRLAGLGHLQSLFQVEADGIPTEFPPLRVDRGSDGPR